MRWWGWLLLIYLGWGWIAEARGEPLVIRFSHVVSEETPKGKGALRFKELAEQYTHGAVRVEVFANGSLFDDREELEALRLGAVHLLAPSLAKFGPLGVRAFELFDLPYLFRSYEAVRRVTEGEVGRRLLGLLEEKGIKGLAFWDNGFKVFSANRPLRRLEDFQGLKIRVQPSRVLEAQVRRLGGVPKVLPFSELHRALRMGVVDGAENPPSNFWTQRLQEGQRYVLVSNHGYLGYAVITNKQFWEQLPTEVRRGLERALAETTAYVNQIAYEENAAALAAIRQAGVEVVEPTPAERAALRAALLPVHEEMAERIGREILEEVYRVTGFAAE
ncbi:MAG: DctP family TRAP transporter solute-binding subunit [Hydrogenophilus sp.]|nr:DctP family TRAP transporter solute-binding subunit [Hydrogenophilus sp.]